MCRVADGGSLGGRAGHRNGTGKRLKRSLFMRFQPPIKKHSNQRRRPVQYPCDRVETITHAKRVGNRYPNADNECNPQNDSLNFLHDNNVPVLG